MKTKHLLLFTRGYPFGDSEFSFLNQEVKTLASSFEKIFIVPYMFTYEEKRHEVPSNVEVLETLKIQHSKSKRKVVDYFLAIKLVFMELVGSKNYGILFQLKYHLSEALTFIALAENVNKLFIDKKINERDTLFYTYWYDVWTSALSVLRYRYKRDIKLVSRAHGYDLYEERRPQGYIFPRYFQSKYVDKVYTISQNGYNYLSSKYPKSKSEFEISRLGVNHTPEMQGSIKKKADAILIVSCSTISAVKRLHKLVEVLSNATVPVRWVHFGSGELEMQIRNAIKDLPDHVTVDLKNSVDNEVVLNFYATNHVDWFINVSESEGIPVSIMEAISFGIPVIATNVGGTSEIVTEITGILIDKNFNSAEVMNTIATTRYTNEQRALIQKFWKENYDAQTNSKRFLKSLLELIS